MSAEIKLNDVSLATENSGSISWGSGVPAGTILQVQSGTYDTQTTISNTVTYVIDLEFQTKGANSKFIAFANAKKIKC